MILPLFFGDFDSFRFSSADFATLLFAQKHIKQVCDYVIKLLSLFHICARFVLDSRFYARILCGF